MKSSPLWLRFYVSHPSSWEQVLIDRTRHHFTLFKLPQLFAVQANRTLSSIRHQLVDLLDSGGKNEVAPTSRTRPTPG